MIDIFKFCPNCGVKLPGDKAGKLLECRNCGFHFYLNVYPTVAAILENKKEEILLVERKNEPKKGYWDLPGGFLEYHESFDAAIKREIKEELGVEIEGLSYIGSSTDLYPYKGITYNTIVAVFSGKIDQEVYPADDVASYRYFEKKNYKKEKFAFPGLSRVIEKYIEKQNKF